MLRYFISDLHLQQARPEITRALLYFLNKIAPGADELYLLGDIFEAWIGDDYADPIISQVAPAFEALQHAGTRIYILHGNRDFLIGQKGAAALSAELLPAYQRLMLKQGEAVILHGDELCLDDLEYQRFRQQVRSTEWQSRFLNKPLSERLAIAKHLRESSREAGTMKSDAIMDVTPSAVEQLFDKLGVQLIIHGHTHRPYRHQYPQGERIVLGDWGDDGWYLRSDDKSLELVHFTTPTD